MHQIFQSRHRQMVRLDYSRRAFLLLPSDYCAALCHRWSADPGRTCLDQSLERCPCPSHGQTQMMNWFGLVPSSENASLFLQGLWLVKVEISASSHIKHAEISPTVCSKIQNKKNEIGNKLRISTCSNLLLVWNCQTNPMTIYLLGIWTDRNDKFTCFLLLFPSNN